MTKTIEKNAEKEAMVYFGEKVTKQIAMIKRNFKTFELARENIVATKITLEAIIKNERLNEYMKEVVNMFNCLFIGSIEQQEQAKLYFENIKNS